MAWAGSGGKRSGGRMEDRWIPGRKQEVTSLVNIHHPLILWWVWPGQAQGWGNTGSDGQRSGRRMEGLIINFNGPKHV